MYLCKWSPCKLSWKLFGTPVGRQRGDISNKMYTRVCVCVGGGGGQGSMGKSITPL